MCSQKFLPVLLISPHGGQTHARVCSPKAFAVSPPCCYHFCNGFKTALPVISSTPGCELQEAQTAFSITGRWRHSSTAIWTLRASLPVSLWQGGQRGTSTLCTQWLHPAFHGSAKLRVKSCLASKKKKNKPQNTVTDTVNLRQAQHSFFKGEVSSALPWDISKIGEVISWLLIRRKGRAWKAQQGLRGESEKLQQVKGIHTATDAKSLC